MPLPTIPKGGKKKRKKKKKKEKNAPKKTKTAYIFFSIAIRNEVKVANPDYSFADVARHIGQLWRTATAEIKLTYQLMATQDKIRYSQDYATYLLKTKNDVIIAQPIEVSPPETTEETIQIWDGPTFEDKFAEGAANAIDLTGE